MPLYNGTQKIKISGVAKVYVGTQLVYQNAPVLTSITLSNFVTSYNTYAKFTFTGTVTAHYSNGTTANVTSACTHTNPNMTSAGTKAVTVTYTENGVTKTASYNITVSKAWRTIYNNSSGKRVLSYSNSSTSAGTWTKGGVPANISSHTEQIRINYTATWSGGVSTGTFKWNNGGNPVVTDTTKRTKYTRTFTYSQGHDIVLISFKLGSNTTNASWYQNGLWTGSGVSGSSGSSGSLTVYKLEEYY